jgi:hypothetical protein
MSSSTTRGLLLAATFLSGLLAGFNLARSLVHNAAWHEFGAAAWAAYSLHADLSPRAALLYPFLGIGVALLSAGAAVSVWRDRGGPPAVAIPLNAGALFAVSGLMMTFLAAPNMLRVPHLLDDPAGLQRALDGFVFWGDIRGALQSLAFAANLWALAAILARGSQSSLPAGHNRAPAAPAH